MASSKKELLERIRKSRNREIMSEFIRVSTSDLYDFNVGRRAVLKEIAFLQVNDEKAHTPPDSPFAEDYVGWCWASQKYLAARVGCSERWVRDSVNLFEKDGVMETREWRDDNGYPHKEYHIKEDVVTVHQRKKDEERKPPKRKMGHKANSGSFQKGNKRWANRQSHRNYEPMPPEDLADSHRNSMPIATGSDGRSATGSDSRSESASSAVKRVLSAGMAPVASLPTPSAGFVFQRVDAASDSASSAPAFGGAGLESAASLAEKDKNKTSNGSSTVANQEKRKTGTITKGERKPLPNRLCYPEAFAHCYDKDGKWIGGKVPRCKRCDAVLHPNENHVCPGYVPKGLLCDADPADYKHDPFAAEDRRERIANAREERFDRIANGKEERTVRCEDCGEELEYLVEHECSVRECRRCGESMYWGTEHICEL